MEGFVYILAGDGGYFKIGMSVRPFQRASQFTALPWNVRLIHVIYSDDMAKAEVEFHRMFEEKRVKSEWFRLSAEDLKWLTSVIRMTEGRAVLSSPCPCQQAESEGRSASSDSCPECRIVMARSGLDGQTESGAAACG